jgi:hypothetical protein
MRNGGLACPDNPDHLQQLGSLSNGQYTLE